MKQPLYIAILSGIAAIFIMSNSCSTYELPIQLDHRGMYLPPPPATIPQDHYRLTNISVIDSSIVIDLRYKTSNNLTKKPLYNPSMPALLRPNTACRLAYANKLLKQQGFRIKVWDAYRPQHAQISLWEASGKDPRYVANPYTNPSLHTHGVAVDVTLVYLDGKPAPMPTKFDDFSKRAATHYYHTDPIVRRNLSILKEAMRNAGFQYIHAEWWHFIDHEWEKYSIIKDIY